MAFEFFSISTRFPEVGQQQLNQFLHSHRVLNVQREVIACGVDTHWAVCVEYTHAAASGASARAKVDYMKVLSREDFAVFSELRKLRKSLAVKASVPPYAVFLDEQLAAFVTQGVLSLDAMAAVDGVGKARLRDYAEPMLALLQKLQADKS